MIRSSLIWNEQLLKSECQRGKSYSVQVLPHAVKELGCETTSLGRVAYIWDYLEKCVISVLRTKDLNMMEPGTKIHIYSGPGSTTKFVFEVKNNPQGHCEKPTQIYPTKYDSIFVAYDYN